MRRRAFLKGLGAAAVGALVAPAALEMGLCPECGANSLLRLPGYEGVRCVSCGWAQRHRLHTFGPRMNEIEICIDGRVEVWAHDQKLAQVENFEVSTEIPGVDIYVLRRGKDTVTFEVGQDQESRDEWLRSEFSKHFEGRA